MRKKLLVILILICVICLHAVVNRVQEKEKFQDLTHNAHRTVLLFCDTIEQQQKYQNVSFEKMLGAYTSVKICLSEWENFRKETGQPIKCRICEKQCKFENQSGQNGIITESLYFSADEIFLDTMKMYYLDEKRSNKEKEAKLAEKNEKIREMVPHFFAQ